MADAVIVNAESGEQEQRPLTTAEQKQRDADAADSASWEAAQDKARARAAQLRGKAKAGTLTQAERDEALALVLDR